MISIVIAIVIVLVNVIMIIMIVYIYIPPSVPPSLSGSMGPPCHRAARPPARRSGACGGNIPILNDS